MPYIYSFCIDEAVMIKDIKNSSSKQVLYRFIVEFSFNSKELG